MIPRMPPAGGARCWLDCRGDGAAGAVAKAEPAAVGLPKAGQRGAVADVSRTRMLCPLPESMRTRVTAPPLFSNITSVSR